MDKDIGTRSDMEVKQSMRVWNALHLSGWTYQCHLSLPTSFTNLGAYVLVACLLMVLLCLESGYISPIFLSISI
jgi:hypothetical protein